MAYSIMEALLYGKIAPWERRLVITDERRELMEQIDREKQYFEEKLSTDDYKRLQSLETLYIRESHCEDVDIYSHGFALGALLMKEILEKKEAVINA